MNYEGRQLGFGCVSLASHSTLSGALNLLSRVFDEGITHFDTSPFYSKGYSEIILGQFARKNRTSITITTKCGLGDPVQNKMPAAFALPLQKIKRKIKGAPTHSAPSAGNEKPLSFRTIHLDYVEKSFYNSLQNLKTDYIDYYLLHESLPSFYTDEAKMFLFKQKEAGRILNLGVAACYVNLHGLKENDLQGWDVLQYENGIGYKTDGLIEQFKTKTHFYHSVLKFLNTASNTSYSKQQLAGMLLSRSVRNNPSGKVLFATTKTANLKNNLLSFKDAWVYTNDELNRILDAVYRP